MKVVKYNVKAKVEIKDAKKEENSLKNGLVKAFTYKKNGNIISPKLTVNDNSIELEGLKFRELINVREFISRLAQDYDAKCGKLNKSENLMTVECNGNNAKLYFEIKTERIKKPKTEKKEEKKQTKEQKQEEQQKETKEQQKEEKSNS